MYRKIKHTFDERHPLHGNYVIPKRLKSRKNFFEVGNEESPDEYQIRQENPSLCLD